VTAFGLQNFATEPRERDGDVVFTEDEVQPLPEGHDIVVEGYYLPAQWRRFVAHDHKGRPSIGLSHPAGAVLQLRVLYPPPTYSLDGFIGVEIYTSPKELPDPDHGFAISGPTGNLRQNERGELLGDGIFCYCPRGPIPTRRRLEHISPNADQVGEQGPPS
jgi:hypothetical protein